MRKLIKYTEILKHTPRTGWLNHEIITPETVAAHSWQMAMMALQLSGTIIDEHYDFNKVIKLCLCHDLGESMIGDITPYDEKYTSKKQIEQEAIAHIAQDGDMPELIVLFEEYEKKETPEAKLANDLDKLDMFIQSLDYENKYPQKDLSEFRRFTQDKIQTKIGQAILRDFMK